MHDVVDDRKDDEATLSQRTTERFAAGMTKPPQSSTQTRTKPVVLAYVSPFRRSNPARSVLSRSSALSLELTSSPHPSIPSPH